MSQFVARGIVVTDELVEKLIGLLVDAEGDTADHPHILICCGESGVTSYLGPFPTAMAAMAAADEQERSWGCIEEDVNFTVAPLLEP